MDAPEDDGAGADLPSHATAAEVLGVDHDADRRAVVEAYRRRVKDAHPDHGGSPAAFKRVRAAYESLMAADRAGGDPGRWDGAGGGEAPDGRWTDRQRARRPGEERSRPGRDGLTPTRVEYLDYDVLADQGWALDDDLFAKAADADLPADDYGRFVADPGEPLLAAAEARGFEWPFSCRGGACANCAVAVLSGELSMPADHILSEPLLERDIRLSCLGVPVTEELQVVYNVKHLPDLEELLLPSRSV